MRRPIPAAPNRFLAAMPTGIATAALLAFSLAAPVASAGNTKLNVNETTPGEYAGCARATGSRLPRPKSQPCYGQFGRSVYGAPIYEQYDLIRITEDDVRKAEEAAKGAKAEPAGAPSGAPSGAP